MKLSARIQGDIVNAYLQLNGKEELSPEETEAFVRTTNRHLMVGKGVVWGVATVLCIVGGGLAGSLLGLSFLASGFSLLVVRLVLHFNIRTEAEGLETAIIKRNLAQLEKRAKHKRKA